MFCFKHFRIEDSHSAMKVNTDSVLLGCLANASEAKRILDIGTGNGLLALMMAQKSSATHIHAIDPDADALIDAAYNFESSKWCNIISFQHITLQEYVTQSKTIFDLIVSNPPYFIADKNYPITHATRKTARQTHLLTFDELASGVASLLSPSGIFYLVLPIAEEKEFEMAASKYGLHTQKRIHVYYKQGELPKRCIAAYGKRPLLTHEAHFYVADKNGVYTAEYRLLTKDFLLWEK
jgi:tRNA1Val (adenine37-N6)-methyltransferase